LGLEGLCLHCRKVSALSGASRVVISDYPESELLENIRTNISVCLPQGFPQSSVVVGHVWGRNSEDLIQANEPPGLFDIIILADLVFNHSEHFNLLKTCASCLSPDGMVIVAFSHHKPENEEKDLRFLTAAVEPPYVFKVEKMFQTTRPPMFPEDDGPLRTRSTVHVYKMYY